jgi:putative zinc finger/helix-turn-helix YgiT family protein
MAKRHQSDRERGDRPYPWECPSCLEGEVYPTTVPYTAEIKHDGLLHTIHVPSLEIPQCRSCGELLFSDHADEQINYALRAHLHLLTPSQIRRRRKQLGLNQGDLAERIGAAEGTISRWETGALIQSRAMDNLLRVFFGLRAVRAVLVGSSQDPNLGLADEWTREPVPFAAEAGLYAQFTCAKAAYGENGLTAEIASFREFGSLLPIGRG